MEGSYNQSSISYISSTLTSSSVMIPMNLTTNKSHSHYKLYIALGVPTALFILFLLTFYLVCRTRRGKMNLAKTEEKANAQFRRQSGLYQVSESEGFNVSEEDRKDSPFNMVYRSTIRYTLNKFRFGGHSHSKRKQNRIDYYNSNINEEDEETHSKNPQSTRKVEFSDNAVSNRNKSAVNESYNLPKIKISSEEDKYES